MSRARSVAKAAPSRAPTSRTVCFPHCGGSWDGKGEPALGPRNELTDCRNKGCVRQREIRCAGCVCAPGAQRMLKTRCEAQMAPAEFKITPAQQELAQMERDLRFHPCTNDRPRQ